jgi:hypothetical protein
MIKWLIDPNHRPVGTCMNFDMSLEAGNKQCQSFWAISFATMALKGLFANHSYEKKSKYEFIQLNALIINI